MTHFVLEVRKKNGKEYPPNTLHHLVCGMMRFIRQNGKQRLNFFKDNIFSDFRSSLDGEMKRLQSKGIGSSCKQAEPLMVDEEEMLWTKKILGDHSPQSLLYTVFFMIGFYFALRSGDEHRQLQYHPCQIKVVEKPRERPYLTYTEDISKNRPGGLKGRKCKPKVVTHYANVENPSRCFVRIFRKYNGLCPPDRSHDAFYLSPMKNPTCDRWFSCEAVSDILSSHKQSCTELQPLPQPLSTLKPSASRLLLNRRHLLSQSMQSICLLTFQQLPADHTGAFYSSSCSNVTINFN